jgi:RimJ/RimL family protein N-acetyltransferase
MIYQLTPSDYPLVREIFATLSKIQPMCTSVLEGVYPGKIFVDNRHHPHSAFLATYIDNEASGIWGFLSGIPTNEAFNLALNNAIFTREVIYPETPLLFLTCEPQDWGGQMKAIFHPRFPVWLPRYHFVSRKVTFDWRSALPEGFIVSQMGEDLLNQPGLELPQDIAGTLQKWQTLRQKNPRFGDFGYVTLDQRGKTSIVSSWATIDFVANGMGDLGFFSQADYRRKGLGTIAVTAAMEHGFQNGLTQVNWTCDAENEGSFRTAEKLGLEKIEDYKMALLLMDEEKHKRLVQEVGTLPS